MLSCMRRRKPTKPTHPILCRSQPPYMQPATQHQHQLTHEHRHHNLHHNQQQQQQNNPAFYHQAGPRKPQLVEVYSQRQHPQLPCIRLAEGSSSSSSRHAGLNQQPSQTQQIRPSRPCDPQPKSNSNRNRNSNTPGVVRPRPAMTASNTTPHQRSSMFSVCKNLTGLPGSEFWHLLGPPSSPPQASSPLSSSSPSPSPGRQGVDSQARGPDNIGTLRIFPPVPRVPVGSRNPGATTTTMITSQRTLPPIPSSPPPSAATASQQSRSPRLVLPLRVNTSAHNEQLLRASPEQASRQEQHETPYRTGDENSGYYNQQQRRQQQQIHDFWQHQHQHQQGQMPTRPVRDMTRREPLPRVRHYDAAQEHADGTGAYPQHIDRTATWPAMPNSSPLEALHIPLLSMTDSRRQRQQPQPALAPLTLESLQYLNKTQQQQPDSTRKDHYFSYNDGYKKKKNNGRDLDSNGVSPLSSPGSSVDGDGNGQSWRDYVVSPVSSVSSP